jgi:DNA polymerase III epsilon subunit-like protein
MHGNGIVIDFEGRLDLGFSQIGYLEIKDFKIINVCEKTDIKDKRDVILDRFLRKKNDFLVAHHHTTEKNFLKKEMPYTNITKTGVWGPWLDTEIIYKKLYPQIKNYKLENLSKEFLNLEHVSNEVRNYSPESEVNFHNPLYDAFCCYHLAKRLITSINLNKMFV